MDSTWIAVDGCTLVNAEQPLRQAEFDDLLAATLEHAERPGHDHLRLTLYGGRGLSERVRDLTERESTCCSFFTFTLTPVTPEDAARTRLLLDIAVTPNRTDVLDALADRAAVLAAGARP
jgi:hypothetical protein